MEDRNQTTRQFHLLKHFKDIYGKGEVEIVKVPARINILGEHIDYINYFQTAVLTFGSAQHDMLIAFRPRQDKIVKAATLAEGLEPKEFSIDEFNNNDTWQNYLLRIGAPTASWANYIKASVFHLQSLYPQKKLKGMEVLVDSNIPIAGGASSSSALVIGSGAAIRKVNDIKIDTADLAHASSKAEWFIGTRGGEMDHATLCLAEPSCALLITFQPFTVKKIPMPMDKYSWVSFYTHPADKGTRLTAAYNERSIVSKFVIPNFLKEIFLNNSNLKKQWETVLTSIAQQNEQELTESESIIKKVIGLLPEKATLKQIEERFKPKEFNELKALYPALFQAKTKEYSLKIRDRAKHHLGEIDRVVKGACLLENSSKSNPDAMQKLGQFINKSHESLKNLYEVSTPELDEAVNIARSAEGVLGARVMGGGFGGNVLVLALHKNVPMLIEKMEKEYYAPNNKLQKRIMISAPGKGVRILSRNNVLCLELAKIVNDWQNFLQNEKSIFSLAEEILGMEVKEFKPIRPIKPIIVAGGKGSRAKKSGLKIPKVVAPIRGEPVIRYALKKFLALPFPVEKPIVVISPENESLVRKALSGYEIDYVVQKKPLGTADAVFSARNQLKNFKGDVAVIWAKQPTVKINTILKTIFLHQAIGSSPMSFPTAKRKNPYAPLKRGTTGWIEDSVETRLEQAQTVNFGEDNIGLFVLPNDVLLKTLHQLHNEYYLPEQKKYNTPKGELGFPNMMVRTLAKGKSPVFSFAMAHPTETKGINLAQDIELIEKILAKKNES